VNIIMTAGNLATIINYVSLGLGVAILTLPATASLLGQTGKKPRLVFRDISDCLGHDQVTLLHRKGRHQPAHLKAFHELAVGKMKNPALLGQ
jgi:DNA-binding transcriptional LysR family regulator